MNCLNDDVRCGPRPRRQASRVPKLVCAIGLLAACGAAHAHYFCVTTAAQLQGALTQSSVGGLYDAEDNTVYMVHGLYQTGAATANAPFFYYAPTSTHSLSIAGGYEDGCSAPTRQTPRTILDGDGHTGVLVLRSTHGDISVRGLTLQNGESSQLGAGLQVNYLVTVDAGVSVTDVIVRNNHSSVDAGGVYLAASGENLWFVNNLVSSNSADGNYGGAYITGYGTYNQIYNNTVTRNTTSVANNPVGGLYCGGTTRCHIQCGIFWNNTGVGLYLGGDLGVLSYNDYGALGGQAPSTSEGNVSIAPQFVDADNGNFHLAGNSPLLATCPYATGAYDIDGNPPTISGMLDAGAFEETIFIDGFDGT
jgi:parallel beta-helix repeat protein